MIRTRPLLCSLFCALRKPSRQATASGALQSLWSVPEPFFFFTVFLKLEYNLLSNVVLVSAAQQRESAVCTRTSPPSRASPPPHVITEQQAELRVLSTGLPLAVRVTHGVCLSALFSWCIPPSPAPASTNPVSVCVSRCVTTDACLTPDLILQKLRLCEHPVHDCAFCIHPQALLPLPLLCFSPPNISSPSRTLCILLVYFVGCLPHCSSLRSGLRA